MLLERVSLTLRRVQYARSSFGQVAPGTRRLDGRSGDVIISHVCHVPPACSRDIAPQRSSGSAGRWDSSSERMDMRAVISGQSVIELHPCVSQRDLSVRRLGISVRMGPVCSLFGDGPIELWTAFEL